MTNARSSPLQQIRVKVLDDSAEISAPPPKEAPTRVSGYLSTQVRSTSAHGAHLGADSTSFGDTQPRQSGPPSVLTGGTSTTVTGLAVSTPRPDRGVLRTPVATEPIEVCVHRGKRRRILLSYRVAGGIGTGRLPSRRTRRHERFAVVISSHIGLPCDVLFAAIHPEASAGMRGCLVARHERRHRRCGWCAGGGARFSQAKAGKRRSWDRDFDTPGHRRSRARSRPDRSPANRKVTDALPMSSGPAC